jgi:hypothetical protein
MATSFPCFGACYSGSGEAFRFGTW